MSCSSPVQAALLGPGASAAPDEVLAIELARAPLDRSLKLRLGISASAWSWIIREWTLRAHRRQEGSAVPGVLLAHLAEWIGMDDGHEGRPPFHDWAENLGWPPRPTASWEAAYLRGHELGQWWRELEPHRSALTALMERMMAGRYGVHCRTARHEGQERLYLQVPHELHEGIALWLDATERAFWSRRMRDLGRQALYEEGSLESWWHRTRRARPDRLGVVRQWWSVVGAALGWTEADFAEMIATGRWPGVSGNRDDHTDWGALARALSSDCLPGVPWGLVSVPVGGMAAGHDASVPLINFEVPRTGDVQSAWLAMLQARLNRDGDENAPLDDILAEAPRIRKIQQAMGWSGAWGEDPSARLLANQTRRCLIPPAPDLGPEELHGLISHLESQWARGGATLRPWSRQYGEMVLSAVLAPLGQALLSQVAPKTWERLQIEARWARSGSPLWSGAVVGWLEDYRASRRPGIPASWPVLARVPGWTLEPALTDGALARLLPLVVGIDRVDEDSPAEIRAAWEEVKLMWNEHAAREDAPSEWLRFCRATLPVAFLASYLDRPFESLRRGTN